MKRILFTLAIAGAFVACGDGSSTGAAGYEDSTNVAPNPGTYPDNSSTGMDTSNSSMDTSNMNRMDTSINPGGPTPQ